MSEKVMLDKQNQLQQKVMELQLLQHQMQQIERQTQMLESQAQEMAIVQAALDEFSRCQAGSESFVAVTPGVFAKAKIEQPKNVIVNIGAGVAVEKPIQEAKQMMAEQGVELRKVQTEIIEQLQKLAQRAESVQEEVQKLVQ